MPEPVTRWQNRIVAYIEDFPVEELVANPHNWRIHPDFQQRALEGILDDVGWVDTVIVNRSTGFVVDGHCRAALALSNNEPTVPALVVELNEAEEAKVIATFDPISNMAVMDRAMYAQITEQITTSNAALRALVDNLRSQAGVTQTESKAGPDVGPKIDRAGELAQQWHTERGQIWSVPSLALPGQAHKLMIGDSLNEQAVYTLMDSVPANIVFTDPPYNLGSDAQLYAKTAAPDTFGELAAAEWDQDFDPVPALRNGANVSAADAVMYVCTSHFLAGSIWDFMKKHYELTNYVVWCKPNPMPSLSKRQFTWGTELICYASRGKHTFNFPADGHALNWWEIANMAHTTPHPTQKPVSVPSKAILYSTERGDVVLDLFGGSGTTTVACEQTARLGYTMELDPRWAAVILQRLFDMGMQPELTN